jgi:hypothetical protein
MIFADRVKQTALVTAYASSVYTINLDSGAAVSGFRTFREGFNVPTVAAQPGTITNIVIPVIIEKGSDWIAGLGNFTRNATGALGDLTLTLDSNAFTTQRNAGGNIFNGDTVTIYAGASAGHSSGVKTRGDVVGSFFSYLGADGEVSIGRSSLADGKHGVAIGNTATVSGAYSVSIGSGVSGGKQLTHNRGQGIGDYGPHSDNFGLNLGAKTVGAYGAADVYQWNENSLRQLVTTNATPANMVAYNIDSNDAAIANSDELYCDSGVSFFSAIITAFQVSTDVTKVWRLEFALKTKMDYSSSAFVGSVVKTVLGTDSGAASWDVAAAISGNAAVIQATGEAAKDILWTASIKALRTVVY